MIKKKRHMQDATLINIRALKKKVADLEKRLRPLEKWIGTRG